MDQKKQCYLQQCGIEQKKKPQDNTLGLKDKNGKEIYEGDIVRIIVNNNIEKICKVEFKNGIFGVMFSKNKELTAFPHFCNTTFEVIGNEYDNPELLGGEQIC